MTLTALLNRPCVITHRTDGATKNIYGAEIPDETVIETVCELQQQRRNENTDRGEISKTTWLFIVASTTPLGASDTVTIDDVDYEVDGEPWRARNPRTQLESHIEATLIRTSAPNDPAEAS